MNNVAALLLMAAGIFLMVAGSTAVVADYGREAFWKNRLGIPQINVLQRLLQAMDRFDNKTLTVGGIAGGAAGILLTRGTPYVLQGFGLGTLMAVGAIYIIEKTRQIHKTNLRRKECFVLFDAVGIYMEAGYGVRKALADGSRLTRELNPAIRRCLNYWSAGAVPALKKLEKEIDLPEGSVLVSLLIQMETYGTKVNQGIMSRETLRMEKLRAKKEKGRVPYKSLYLSLYRFLPIMAVFGLVVGAAFVYSLDVLSSVGIDLF